MKLWKLTACHFDWLNISNKIESNNKKTGTILIDFMLIDNNNLNYIAV